MVSSYYGKSVLMSFIDGVTEPLINSAAHLDASCLSSLR